MTRTIRHVVLGISFVVVVIGATSLAANHSAQAQSSMAVVNIVGDELDDGP
jgi:hypothetical protein